MPVKKRKIWILLLLCSVSFIPVSYAREVSYTFRDFASQLSNVSKNIFSFFQDEYIVYVATIVLMYILLYSIISRLLSRVRLFEGEAGVSVNTSGKMAAHAFTGLMCLGIFAFRKSVLSFIKSILLPFGFFGALVISIVVFTITYRNIEVQRARFWWSLLVASITLIIYGLLVGA